MSLVLCRAQMIDYPQLRRMCGPSPFRHLMLEKIEPTSENAEFDQFRTLLTVLDMIPDTTETMREKLFLHDDIVTESDTRNITWMSPILRLPSEHPGNIESGCALIELKLKSDRTSDERLRVMRSRDRFPECSDEVFEKFQESCRTICVSDRQYLLVMVQTQKLYAFQEKENTSLRICDSLYAPNSTEEHALAFLRTLCKFFPHRKDFQVLLKLCMRNTHETVVASDEELIELFWNMENSSDTPETEIDPANVEEVQKILDGTVDTEVPAAPEVTTVPEQEPQVQQSATPGKSCTADTSITIGPFSLQKGAKKDVRAHAKKMRNWVDANGHLPVIELFKQFGELRVRRASILIPKILTQMEKREIVTVKDFTEKLTSKILNNYFSQLWVQQLVTMFTVRGFCEPEGWHHREHVHTENLGAYRVGVWKSRTVHDPTDIEKDKWN